jgi:hypothetical protein
MDDRPWSENRVVDLMDGAHIEMMDGKAYVVEAVGLTYWEQKARAYDTGDPTVMLDAIQLDAAIDRMVDMAAKAAIVLKLAQWDYANIGAVIRDKRRRTGAMLVEDGIRQIVRHERKRGGRG